MIDFSTYFRKEPDLILKVPTPPSVNACYKSFVKNGKILRAKSKQYKDWVTAANNYLFLNQYEYYTLQPPYAVIYEVAKPHDNRRRDVANYEKPLTDFLVTKKVFEDDYLIEANIQTWAYNAEVGFVTCNIFSLE